MSSISRVRRWTARVGPFFILAIPSVWLLLTLPPLWRDVDAYVQTVFPPKVDTILLHGPLYCAINRIPLWLGYLATGIGRVVSLDHFIRHTQLTDRGVLILILSQHLTLWLGALYLITGIAFSTVVRLCLAAVFASQPLFYTFAHCVGSETASMILGLFFVGSGLRIVRQYPVGRTTDWLCFTTLLCLLVLTRHINAALAAVLPSTAIIIAACNYIFRARGGDTGVIPPAESSTRRPLAFCFWSAAVVAAALLWASGLTHLLCWQSGVEWRPKFGFTFLWRLNFLESLDPASRHTLLNYISSKCELSDARRILERVDVWFEQHHAWDPQHFVRETNADLPSRGRDDAQFPNDLALNEIAHCFLSPPNPALALAALKDFTAATLDSESSVVDFLFATTDYVFTHADDMPQAAQLTTFRQPRNQFLQNEQRPYFHWWARISCRGWAALAAFLLVCAYTHDRRYGGRNAGVVIFAACVGVSGIGMVFLNCFFAQIQPRFVLPMLEFIFLSILITLSVIFECVKTSNQAMQRTAPRSDA